ncbi:protodermal factor 1 [Cocos nucifera]|uniref:Protodermal factor 1 n=1 Tax=Cocos nucifera TaxID=13894 RepID=A0A8K0NCP0_COCNU|nr:protodermal factor 1 [Cocos nucifera]
MELEKKGKALLMFFLFVGLVSHQAVTPVKCRSLEKFDSQKNYYPPDPHAPSHPRHSHNTPCGTPPHGGTPTPSHGGGGYHNPPSGGGHYYNPPSDGGYFNPPSAPVGDAPPSPPRIPLVPPTPLTPGISTPPAPPFMPAPNFPPFFPGTCDYWRTHPAVIFGLFGYWCNIGQLFGLTATSAFESNLSLPEALANTRSDGFGALLREGTASFLNSMVSQRFPLTTQQVRDAFADASVSNKAAAAQAKLFKKANEGHLKHN